jgi:prepilin-type N-terminal cleavage/methylation domain-containing protein
MDFERFRGETAFSRETKGHLEGPQRLSLVTGGQLGLRERRGPKMSHWKHEKRNERGFTLFELLVVLIILAILAGIVTYAVGGTQANSIASSCSTDAKSFQTALEEYRADLNSYPPLGTGVALTSTVTVNGTTYGPFMRSLPSTANYEIMTDANGGVFVYPAGALPNGTAHGMQTQTVGGAWNYAGTPNANTAMLLDYGATNGAICNNPYLDQSP